MTAPATFKQADVTRALLGAKKAGLLIGTVRIDPNGRIEIVASKPGGIPGSNSWDDVLP